MAFAAPVDFTQPTAYKPIPPDNYLGVCIGVMDLGTHTETFPGEAPRQVHKIKLQFELDGEVRDDGLNAVISATFNCSINEKAKFRQLLDNWLGASWPEQYKGQPWSFLIGKPCMVNVQSAPSKTKPGKTSTWVSAVSKPGRGTKTPTMTRETFFFDLDHKELPSILSKWDAEIIRSSKEYGNGVGWRDDAPSGDAKPAEPTPQREPAMAGGRSGAKPMSQAEADDSIPF